MTRRGSVLILTVWVVSLLSILAAGLGSRGVFALGVADRLEEYLRAYYTAAGGVPVALKLMRQDPTPKYDGLSESWYRMEDWLNSLGPEISVDVGPGLEDEERKLNLNKSSVELLRNFLRACGVKTNEAVEIADAILDWRDEDDRERDNGAEGTFYRGLEQAYDCKDGPFESVEELLLVKGITPALWVRLAPYLTVYGSGRVNVNTASRPVLAALGLSPAGLNSLLAYRSGQDGKPGTADDFVFTSVDEVTLQLSSTTTPLSTEDQNRLTRLQAEGLVGVGSEAFRLQIRARVPYSKAEADLDCVIDRSGQILAWSER